MSDPAVRTPVVWIVNRSGHPYEKAERFGRLMSLTSGNINPFRTDRQIYLIGQQLRQADVVDFMLVSGLPILNAITLAMWLERFGKVNILQWSTNNLDYVHLVIDKSAIAENAGET